MRWLYILPVAFMLALKLAAQSPDRPIQNAQQTAQTAQAQGARNQDTQKKTDQAPPAQTPQGGKELSSESVQEMVKGELETGETTYRYDARGRRDPFRSLLLVNTPSERQDCQKGTVGCILWDDITLQGIWKVRGILVSQVLAKNGDVYWIKDADALFDGMVTKIAMDCVYFKQKVNDPTKINPFRDVEKCLSPEATK